MMSPAARVDTLLFRFNVVQCGNLLKLVQHNCTSPREGGITAGAAAPPLCQSQQ